MVKMVNVISSEIVKGYGLSAGASVVGIASSKDFGLAPEGFKPVDVLPECLSVIVLGTTFPMLVLNDMALYTASRN
ncbi:MAG: epoxyqueuosine reductase, partial [Nitrososphaerota archaeon]|nr:epoxyqueuosine reductase [Nitrososphaerota archaeon]